MTILKLNFSRFLFLAVISLFLFSCKSENLAKKDYEAIVISKKWTYDVQAIRSAVDSMEISPQDMNIIGRTLTNLGGAVFSFQEDGTLLLDLPTRTLEGKWLISDDAKIFHFGVQGSILSAHPINEINESQINLESSEGGIFFPRIFKVVETAPGQGQ